MYRALRTVNPSPYMYYLDLEDFHIVGSSPEILARLEDGQVTVRPIAGTRRRGHTDEEDLHLEQELISDPKELAEHLMLVDLGRNDVGRIAQIGSVKLTAKMEIERYSHVMHIASNVVGQLRDDYDAIDVLRATFPAHPRYAQWRSSKSWNQTVVVFMLERWVTLVGTGIWIQRSRSVLRSLPMDGCTFKPVLA